MEKNKGQDQQEGKQNVDERNRGFSCRVTYTDQSGFGDFEYLIGY